MPEIAGRNYSNGDVAVGAGLIVSLIAIFLPWYSASFNGAGISGYGGFSTSASTGGLGYWAGWIFFIAVLAGLALFIIRTFATGVTLPALPQPDAILYAIIGAVMVVMALIWLLLGSSNSVSGPGYSAGPSFGLFIGLVAAVAVAVGGYIKRSEPAAVTASYSAPPSPTPYGGGTPPPPPPV